MLATGLVLSRFAHYAALLALFGISLFPLHASRRGEHMPGAVARTADAAVALAAIVALASGLAMLVMVAATMAGSWAELDWAALASVATESTYGRVWIAHLCLAAATMALALTPRVMAAPSAPWILSISSGLLLASLALVGHAQDGHGSIALLHILADGLHLIAAGAWLGGIVALLILIDVSVRETVPEANEVATLACARFAGIGTLCVATLILSGAINTWLLVPSATDLVTAPYGQLLLVKLTLFCAMLLLAAINRFKAVPDLLAARGSDRSKAALVRLRRHVWAEQVLGVMIVAAVSALGTMQPGPEATASARRIEPPYSTTVIRTVSASASADLAASGGPRGFLTGER